MSLEPHVANSHGFPRARVPARSVCLVTLSLSEAGPGRFGRQASVTDIYHATRTAHPCVQPQPHQALAHAEPARALACCRWFRVQGGDATRRQGHFPCRHSKLCCCTIKFRAFYALSNRSNLIIANIMNQIFEHGMAWRAAHDSISRAAAFGSGSRESCDCGGRIQRAAAPHACTPTPHGNPRSSNFPLPSARRLGVRLAHGFGCCRQRQCAV